MNLGEVIWTLMTHAHQCEPMPQAEWKKCYISGEKIEKDDGRKQKYINGTAIGSKYGKYEAIVQL